MANSKQSQDTQENPELQALESYVAALESFICEPIALINPNGIISDVNKEFASYLNKAESQLVGKKLVSLLQEGDPLVRLREESRDISNPAVAVFDVNLRIEEAVKPTQLRVQEWVGQSGELRGYMVSFDDAVSSDADYPSGSAQNLPASPADDIPNSANFIEQVKEQQMRTQSVLYNITDGLIFLDSDKKVDMVNPSAANMLDIHASDLIGKHIKDLRNNELVSELRTMLLEKDKLSKKELTIGTESYFEVTTIDIGDKKDSTQQVVILHDISEKRKIEEMKLEFASVAAHQMRTPLSSIRWSFEILSKRLEDEELLKAAQRGYKSTEQVLEVVDELLNVDRLEEGDSGYQFESVDIIEMLDELIQTESESQAVLDQPDINFNKPVDHVPSVRGDERKLKIVFKNLLDNALKYTDSDAEVSIRVNIKMTSGYGGDVVVTEIEDEGIGIPEESQDKVFSKFYRADNATDMETEGTGVGLFITKEIVEAHNGKIWFDSTPGEGTTFYVQLPMASDN
jgi:PAS domain S-box-containing protein